MISRCCIQAAIVSESSVASSVSSGCCTRFTNTNSIYIKDEKTKDYGDCYLCICDTKPCLASRTIIKYLHGATMVRFPKGLSKTEIVLAR